MSSNHQEWLDLTTITATHCCCCRAKLTDAVSVNRGIGPDCSAKHYKIEHDITPAMVEVAIGILFASGLDQLVKVTAIRLKDRPRDLANILVKWASAHYDQREVVFDVANTMAALGFTALAAKLREDRTKVHLRQHPTAPDRFTIHTGRSWQFDRLMRRIPGATKADKIGRYEGWSFPQAAEAAVITIAGHVFPDQWATLIDRTGRLKSHGYYEVQKAIDALYPKPAVQAPVVPAGTIPALALPANTSPQPSGIMRVLPDGNLEIRTPRWNGPWLDEFKQLVPWKRRRWTGSSWVCDPRYKDDVAALIRKHYQMEP